MRAMVPEAGCTLHPRHKCMPPSPCSSVYRTGDEANRSIAAGTHVCASAILRGNADCLQESDVDLLSERGVWPRSHAACDARRARRDELREDNKEPTHESATLNKPH